MHPAIEVTGLRKRYGDAQVLDNLDLHISDGVFALLGANGAGKTTLVSILTTLVKPDGGTARILGHDVTDEPASVRSLIRVTGQAASLDELLTGRENLTLIGRLLGLGNRARSRADELLDRLDLVEAGQRAVRLYSGGMRRRLDLAASLIAPTGVLFLDEPTTGLDPTSRARVWDDIRALSRAGTTVFLTTQTLEEAEVLADRIAVLQHGRIIADGTAAELTSRVGGQTVALVAPDGSVSSRVETDGSLASVTVALERMRASAPPGSRVQLHSPSLDDAFSMLTGTTKETAA